MGHAGELETSLILHLKPELVNMDQVVDETDFIATASYTMDWVEGGALAARRREKQDGIKNNFRGLNRLLISAKQA
jgi:creatinine amidohydrolase/Fe(II)-dependent formamide hydrolase-like protein